MDLGNRSLLAYQEVTAQLATAPGAPAARHTRGLTPNWMEETPRIRSDYRTLLQTWNNEWVGAPKYRPLGSMQPLSITAPREQWAEGGRRLMESGLEEGRRIGRILINEALSTRAACSLAPETSRERRQPASVEAYEVEHHERLGRLSREWTIELGVTNRNEEQPFEEPLVVETAVAWHNPHNETHALAGLLAPEQATDFETTAKRILAWEHDVRQTIFMELTDRRKATSSELGQALRQAMYAFDVLGPPELITEIRATTTGEVVALPPVPADSRRLAEWGPDADETKRWGEILNEAEELHDRMCRAAGAKEAAYVLPAGTWRRARLNLNGLDAARLIERLSQPGDTGPRTVMARQLHHAIEKDCGDTGIAQTIRLGWYKKHEKTC